MKKLKILMALAGLMAGASVGTVADAATWLCRSCTVVCDSQYCYWHCTGCQRMWNIDSL